MTPLLSSLSALLLAVGPNATSPPVQEVAEVLDRGAVEKHVDQSQRWLRAQQDPESGAYGSVLETARVLHTLATSHRAYRPSDGPFVSAALRFLEASQGEDGSFGEPSASAAERGRNTWWALAALRELGMSDGDATARGAAWLAAADVAAPDRGDLLRGVLEEADRSDDERRARLGRYASELVRSRHDTGYWSGAEGSLIDTCDALDFLNEVGRALKRLEPAKPARDAQPLPTIESAEWSALRERAEAALARGREFLLANQEAEGRWGFGGQADPGITAMVAGALQQAPASATRDASLGNALDWMTALQKPDGSIHAGQLANYVTSAAVMALARAQREGDVAVVARAKDYLQILQADEGEGYGSSDRFYGGVGYGGDERPDLSNLQMALEALNAAGVEGGDPTFQRALVFLQRCQNRSESNDFEVREGGVTTVSGNDGGAGYAPGDSKAGFVELSDGRRVPRSYGSMTYALLKGYLFAGLPRDDARVQAAWEWLSKHYTLDVNPGFETAKDPTAPYQGLFYYFVTMAKALDLYGSETITDAAGDEHRWREELVGRLLAMQRQDGSWINANAPRWYEGNPVLATSYAMEALGIALAR